MVCHAITQGKFVWEPLTRTLENKVNQLSDWTKKKKAVSFTGTNEDEFVQAMGKWLLSNQAIRDNISQAGYSYSDLKELIEGVEQK